MKKDLSQIDFESLINHINKDQFNNLKELFSKLRRMYNIQETIKILRILNCLDSNISKIINDKNDIRGDMIRNWIWESQ